MRNSYTVQSLFPIRRERDAVTDRVEGVRDAQPVFVGGAVEVEIDAERFVIRQADLEAKSLRLPQLLRQCGGAFIHQQRPIIERDREAKLILGKRLTPDIEEVQMEVCDGRWFGHGRIGGGRLPSVSHRGGIDESRIEATVDSGRWLGGAGAAEGGEEDQAHEPYRSS